MINHCYLQRKIRSIFHQMQYYFSTIFEAKYKWQTAVYVENEK